MKITKTAVMLLALIFVFYNTCIFAAEEESFPKIGFAKNDGSNVRAGDNVNFETLCKLKKGDPVKIFDKRYSWFKLALPKTACLYIKGEYVDVDPETGIGTVNAMQINLRAGPATAYSILGQASKPETLNIISEKDGWYKIEPPSGTFGWIHESQVSFDFKITEEAPIMAQNPEEKLEEKTNIMLKPGAPKRKGNLVFSTQDAR